MNQQWEPVIGLEIHIQLATKSKIFCGSSTAYGAAPNTQASALDLGMPGTLPVLNREVLNMAIRFGLAIGARIATRSVFARKNYFYPDLPKGYQITQFELPIVGRGELQIDLDDGSSKSVGITRAHLEEDAGKSVHEGLRGHTGVDLNRAGTPLLELVSEPEMFSAREAVAFMRKVHTLVRYLGICDGNMQEGSFRCDANVSVRPQGQRELGTRAELKNINSFRFVERAIDYEIHRQVHLLESGAKIVQETRLYDSDRNETRSMRSKEEAEDYRYFPDPDLLPVIIETSLLDEISASIPELPDARKQRFMQVLGLGQDDAVTLTTTPELADWFEQALAEAGGQARVCANWVLVELTGALHKAALGLADSPVSPSDLAGLLKRLHDGTISGKIAKMVFDAMFNGEGSADAIIEARGLKQITDTSMIETVVDQVLASHPEQIEQYRSGDVKVFNFFVGQVMKETRGKANPSQLREMLQLKLS
jgi:aspartyl-tRNA(Asn)/glutamyl-tRNA(Gln) amidotransferase subunit B